ncbi:VOC family protein [Opitutaceae bacterium]|nr:VOC family protein [Opitutaceae bacterium]
MAKTVLNTIPVLPVSDLKRSLQFYTETLGWKQDWSGEKVGSVSRDGSCLMLSQLIPVTSGNWAWVGLPNDTLIETYRQAGVTIVQEPENWSWGYEMKIADPDGNVLWLGTATRTDLPVVDAPPKD